MAITANYPVPVSVNGYQCNNCADVAEAKKDINPAHPQDGPGGINAHPNPAPSHGPAVQFGGALAGLSAPPGVQTAQATPQVSVVV